MEQTVGQKFMEQTRYENLGPSDEQGKIVAMICHTGWVAISAGIVDGKRVTSVGSIRDDLVNAGAEWVDEEVVQDGNLISSRGPKDRPAFCRRIIETQLEVIPG